MARRYNRRLILTLEPDMDIALDREVLRRREEAKRSGEGNLNEITKTALIREVLQPVYGKAA